MKTVVAILGWAIAAVSSGMGQGLSIELALDQEQYLPGESLPIRVRITNFSGQNLQLGKDESWLTFSVEDSRRVGLSKQAPVPVKGEFSLEPSMTATKRADLAPYFDLTTPGRYYVSATVSMPQWNQALTTKAASFDIIKGSSLWEQEFGVPGTGQAAGTLPEIRRYALVQTLHSRTLRLYFRLTDSREGRIFKIFPLGQMVSFSNPEPQLDKFSNLHVLYQTAGRAFLHCLINPDGLLISRETYEYGNSRPVLRSGKDGRISVEGGVRRFTPSDLPPPASPTDPSNGKLDQP